MLERHLSKRKRQRVAIKKKIAAANSRASDFERIKENIFRASGKTEKNQEISILDRIFSGNRFWRRAVRPRTRRSPPAGST
jgi:hypothetical protein